MGDYLFFCPAIMKFMGDFPMKGQTEQDLVATILKVNNNEQSFYTKNKQDFCVLLYYTDLYVIFCS